MLGMSAKKAWVGALSVALGLTSILISALSAAPPASGGPASRPAVQSLASRHATTLPTVPAGAKAPGALSATDPQESVRVYQKVSPSVVALSSIEGSGTGIVIDSSGLILTNAHVVSTPLPLRVVAQNVATHADVTFNNVKVVGFHPTLDLALVRIDPAKLRASKAELASLAIAARKSVPGERVYIIGNPAAGDLVLTKSITSGMIAAVGRVVEGERYDQLDASVNPGNSGGPVCSSTGEALGLVTFKFTNVQAISFAIPLQGVDFKAFQPLAKRKSDPARARQLLKLAEHYGDLAESAERREGADSSVRRIYNYYAVTCYRLALIENPTDPDTAYNIGMLLRTLDQNDAAAAYLLRSIDLQPWSANGNAYRELGFALVKQKKDKQALAAWNEGISKAPYSAKIWEDLAIFHHQHGDAQQAAIAASAALLIADQSVRFEQLQKLASESKAQAASDGEPVDDQVEPAALVSRLDRLLAGANAAIRARKVWVTGEFAAVVAELGGSTVDPADRKMPQNSIARLPELARYDHHPDDPRAAPSRTRPQDAAPPKDAAATQGVASPQGVADAPAPDPKSEPAAPPAPAGKPGTGVASVRPGPKAPAVGDWIGTGRNDPVPGVARAAQPQPSSRNLAGVTATVVDAQVTYLEGISGPIGLVFSTEGDTAFILEKGGRLLKVAVPSMGESLTLKLGGACSALSRCSEGLVVAVKELQEVWIVAEKDLRVLRRCTVPDVDQVAATPALPFVWAVSNNELISCLDGKSGRTIYRQKTEDLGNQRGLPPQARHIRFERLVASNDGHTLFCDDSSYLFRLQVRNGSLIFDGVSPAIGQNPQGIVVSPDSRYVAMPSGGGNSSLPASPVKPYTTYVFRVSDLDHPVVTLHSGAYPTALAFDPARKTLYAQNFEHALMTFLPDGSKVKSYDLQDTRPKRFITHPAGGKLFILAEENVVWVELP